jgi:UDP-N-acetylglucosamine 4-epimerase
MESNIDLSVIKQSSYLVTGGAGFIGSNIVEKLLLSGAKHVRVLDNLSTGYKKNIQPFFDYPNFEFIEGDIRNIDTCIEACKDIDFVSHQAALGSVPRSLSDPITTNAVNIDGFLNMFEAVRKNNVKRMVYAASSSTYGDSLILPKTEDNIGKPLSPYAVTKYVNELYAHVYHLNFGTETIGFRYFNVFGPRQNPKGAYAAVIPLFIQATLKDTPIVINGDGEQTRDFTYIDNAVLANILGMCSSNKEAINQVFNIAGGGQVSLNELVSELSTLSGKQIIPQYGPTRKGDVRDSKASIDKAKRLLNYTPLFSYQEGIKKSYEWFSTNQSFIDTE